MKSVFCKLAVISVLFLGIGLLALPAQATYSGLIIIPTTDTLESGQFGLEAQIDGTFNNFSENDVYILNTQYGFNDKFEAGADFDLSKDADPRVFLNGKYKFFNNQESGTSLALGIFNCARNLKSVPYIVATQDFKSFRLHLGGMRTESNNRWFIGADKCICERFTLMADYTSGDENVASAGFNYQFNDSFGVMAGMVFPNESGSDTQFTVHFVYTGP